MVVRVFNPKKKRKIKKKNKQNKSPRNTYTETGTHIGNSLNTKSETVICNQKTNKVKGAWKKTYETKNSKNTTGFVLSRQSIAGHVVCPSV